MNKLVKISTALLGLFLLAGAEIVKLSPLEDVFYVSPIAKDAYIVNDGIPDFPMFVVANFQC